MLPLDTEAGARANICMVYREIKNVKKLDPDSGFKKWDLDSEPDFKNAS